MLAHYVAGDPKASLVVLVHGVCDGAVGWVRLVKHLSDRYFVVAFDSLGHGLSRRYRDDELEVPGDSGMRELESSLEYITKLYGRTPVVIAHSMGAAMSSKLSTLRPDLFKALILEDPAWLSDSQAQGYRDRASEQVTMCAQWHENSLETIAANVELRPHWDAASHAGSAFAKALVDARLLSTGVVSFPDPWLDIARAITVPTVIIVSDTDEVLVQKEDVAAIEDLHNDALTIEMIPGASHGIRLDAGRVYDELVDRHLAAWLA